MKTYMQVHEIFPWLKGLHMQEADFYRACRAKTHHERARMLLEYAESLEIESAEQIADFQANSSRKVLNTYLQYIPEQIDMEDRAADASDWTAPNDISTSKSADLILERSGRLESVYLKLAEISDMAMTRQMFSDMARLIRTRRQHAIESYDHLNDI